MILKATDTGYIVFLILFVFGHDGCSERRIGMVGYNEMINDKDGR
jgi:hypothetical protein